MRNLGNGRFVDVAQAVGVDDIRDTRGVAVADFDNDGDLDVVVNHNPGIRTEIAPTLYRNDIGQRQHWLQVELVGTRANRDAVGSEVRLDLADGRTLTRHVLIGSGYASQSSRRLHFGVGETERIKSLEVTWLGPGGGRDVFEDLRANQFLRIVQGREPSAATLTAIDPSSAIRMTDSSERGAKP